jgi:hypothetical protein
MSGLRFEEHVGPFGASNRQQRNVKASGKNA